MDTKQLKQKILDLAIRGKLVPQDPKDEPASVLLERIRKEKEQLIASGKLKKSKSKTTDTPHYENVPFEIPDSWEWVRLGELYNAVSAKRVLQADWKQEGVPFYRAREIVKLSQFGFVDNDLFITEEHYQSLKAAYGIPLPNDIILSAVGTIGKTYIVRKSDKFYYKDASVLCLQNLFKLNSQYIQIALNSPVVQDQMHEQSKGTTVDTITIEKVGNYILPLPPLAEQKRIVAELERWFALIDEIEQNKVDLREYIKQAKSKVLDLAIYGKLVPQDPNDEPAIDLLKRINPHFTPCDTSHYENLPEGWTVLTVGKVADYINGRAFKPSEWEQTGLPIIRIQNLNDEEAAYNYSTAHFEDKYLVHNGDLLFAWAASLGTYIWQKEDAWLNQHIFKVIPKPFIERDFLYYSFINMIDDFYAESHGSGMVHITKGKFETRPILIPPLAEQKRIVERIETIFAQLDTITAEL